MKNIFIKTLITIVSSLGYILFSIVTAAFTAGAVIITVGTATADWYYGFEVTISVGMSVMLALVIGIFVGGSKIVDLVTDENYEIWATVEAPRWYRRLAQLYYYGRCEKTKTFTAIAHFTSSKSRKVAVKDGMRYMLRHKNCTILSFGANRVGLQRDVEGYVWAYCEQDVGN